jgi:hypothetical protein
MKVKAGNVAPAALPTVRGVVLTLDTKHGPVMQKWPRKRGKATEGGAYYQQQEFGIVAHMVSTPFPIDYGTAVHMAKGTTFIPRDILMMAAYGKYYTIQQEDGFIWPWYREMTVNAQLVLDQVTDETGAMMYRSDVGWIGISPGSNGYILTSVNGVPTWTSPSIAPGLAGEVWLTSLSTGANAGLQASKGGQFTPMIAAVCQGGTCVVNEIAGATYRVEIFQCTDTALGTLVATTGDFVAAATVLKVRPFTFTTPVALIAEQKYAVLHTRRDATDTTSSGVFASASAVSGIPLFLACRQIALAKKAPASGNVIVLGASGPIFAINLMFG